MRGMKNPSLNRTAAGPLDAPDRTVLLYGVIAALLGVCLHQLMAHRMWPWGHPFALYFLLQWLALAPLAGALLSGSMQSPRRWLAALAIYGVLLPAVTAYGLTATYGALPNERGGWLSRGDYFMPLLLTSVAGFVALPLLQALDPRRPQWDYPAVFRAAWRAAVHLGLSLCLASCVCLLLAAAGAMFDMIGIRLVRGLVENATFRFAVWPMILAACLVGVRRRPALTETLQRSWLTLNAWLLPLVTLVGLAFTVALAARLALGLQAVQLSAGALIAFSLVWIKLINAAWQDSPNAAPFGPRLRRALRWAMACLLPLAAVALYGAAVRVDQYGWTVLRAWGVGSSVILVLYGAGYAWAALRSKHDYATLAATNLVAAFATLALLLAFNTPIANPMKLTAESQFQRLIDGRKDPQDFSFYAMGNDYGRWGKDALRRLAEGAANARDPRIATAAAETLKGGYFQWDKPGQAAADAAPVDAPPLATTPSGRDVPSAWWGFLRAEFAEQARVCATPIDPPTDDASGTQPCQVIYADLTGDGQEEIILYVAPQQRGERRSREWFIAFAPNAAGQWRHLGYLYAESFEQPLQDATGVDDIAQALKQGLVRTQPRADRDLMIGDQLLRLR